MKLAGMWPARIGAEQADRADYRQVFSAFAQALASRLAQPDRGRAERQAPGRIAARPNGFAGRAP